MSGSGFSLGHFLNYCCRCGRVCCCCSDLGCHIDGFIATQATTVLISPDGIAAVVSGKEADLIEAARTAFNAALRLIKPGKRVADVSPKLAACVEPFGVNLVEGVMSHIMKQVGQGVTGYDPWGQV